MTAAVLRRIRLTIQRSSTWGPLALAVGVGFLAGIGAIALRWMISVVHGVFFDDALRLHDLGRLPVPVWLITLLAPAIGMVIVAYLTRWWAPEARGHGIPEVQYAVRILGGRIRTRVAFAKSIASAISIGSGGSLGREGAIVQIGSSLGSLLGQAVGLGAEDVRLLVAAGAAGAISATFNAPIGGVIFALEVVLGSFAARSFGLVVVSSVTATAVAQAALGTEPAFRLVEQFQLVSYWELWLYLLLGLVTGIVAVIYVRTVYGVEDGFDRWKAPMWLKAVTAGLILGALGTFGSRHLFGIGHEGVELAMAGGLATGLMAALVFMKIFATSITLAGGGSGGIFAPALFIGAMAGGTFGRAAGALLPTLTASPGAYAIVGAAAVFGAAAHAPMTAIIILFEMTNNYRIILPLMVCVVLAQLLASRLFHDSMYTIKLRRLGGMADATKSGTLDLLLVVDAMSEEVPTVGSDLPLADLAERAQLEDSRSWVVLDEEEELRGIVSVADLARAVMASGLQDRTVADIMTTAVVTCEPGESLRQAFRRFSDHGVYQVPVVDPEEHRKVLGVLQRKEMMWAFKELSDEHQRLMDRTDSLPHERRFETVSVELQVTPTHNGICNHKIREIDVPEYSLIALLRRGARVVVPRGFTRVEPGDVLTLITTQEHERGLRAWIASGEHGV